jgi:ATP-binding cassette subfamily F protein uup
MNVIDATDLSKSYGPTCLMDGVGFAIGENDRVGVVGRNGCGKSTLFRILAGLEWEDSGTIARKKGLTVGYLPQRPDLDPKKSVRTILEEHLGDAHKVLKRHEELSHALADAREDELERLLELQHEAQSWLDHHSAWNLGHRINEMCTRFSIDDPDALVGTLSGGWGQRVALAGILLSQPDLILLDEPTNQLDADTVQWLETHLSSYPGALLLITHDRYFLDRVVTHMFELDGGVLNAYSGGYSSYLVQKAEQLEADARGQTRLLNLLRREEAWLRRGAKARTTKQKARIGRVEDLRGQKTAPSRRDVSFALDTDKRLGSTIIDAKGVTVELGGQTLVAGLDYSLRKGERIGILGPNGCGKTSLIKALLGELPLASGTVTLGKNTLIGYIDQIRSGLDETLTVGDSVSDNDWVTVGGPNGRKRHKIGYLEDFLFTPEDQRAPVSTLSGGERARLLLAKLMLKGANVLVLDEPTNDLDIPTLQLLDAALCDFPGSVLMVTHDRYFLDRVATGILDFQGEGRVVFYEGNYEIFNRLKKIQHDEAQDALKSKTAKAATPVVVKSPEKKQKKSGLNFNEKRELDEIEGRIEALEEKKAKIERSLSDPTNLTGGHEELGRLSAEVAEVDGQLTEAMERWEELEAKS